MNITSLTDADIPWECWKSPTTNLVYFVHSKCASRTYDRLMNRLQWCQTATNSIDWHRDTVFSFIRNPIDKHRKGIVEFFYYNQNLTDLIKQIDQDSNWITLLSHVAYLDHHSISIRNMLGKNAEKVKWIPIDTAFDHKAMTFELLEKHGELVPIEVKNWFLNLPKINESTPKQTAIYTQLRDLPTPPHVVRYLDYDDILYRCALIDCTNQNNT